jgi:hypothetical protein
LFQPFFQAAARAAICRVFRIGDDDNFGCTASISALQSGSPSLGKPATTMSARKSFVRPSKAL